MSTEGICTDQVHLRLAAHRQSACSACTCDRRLRRSFSSRSQTNSAEGFIARDNTIMLALQICVCRKVRAEMEYGDALEGHGRRLGQFWEGPASMSARSECVRCFGVVWISEFVSQYCGTNQKPPGPAGPCSSCRNTRACQQFLGILSNPEVLHVPEQGVDTVSVDGTGLFGSCILINECNALSKLIIVVWRLISCVEFHGNTRRCRYTEHDAAEACKILFNQ